jgi:hypothetical protein
MSKEDGGHCRHCSIIAYGWTDVVSGIGMFVVLTELCMIEHGDNGQLNLR